MKYFLPDSLSVCTIEGIVKCFSDVEVTIRDTSYVFEDNDDSLIDTGNSVCSLADRVKVGSEDTLERDSYFLVSKIKD